LPSLLGGCATRRILLRKISDSASARRQTPSSDGKPERGLIVPPGPSALRYSA